MQPLSTSWVSGRTTLALSRLFRDFEIRIKNFIFGRIVKNRALPAGRQELRIKNVFFLRLSLSLSLSLSLTLCLPAQSDLQIYKHFTHADGLSSNMIHALHQDSRGFLWIGTLEGLSRFDGLHFKTFYHDRDSVNSLPHNKVSDILEFEPGMLLLSTTNGLAVYNMLTGKFDNERITHPPLAAGSGANIGNLHQDADGTIWVNHGGELDLLDRNLQFLSRFTDLEWTAALKGCIAAYEDWQYDRAGRLWLPTDTTGIQIIDFNNHVVYNEKNNPADLPYLKFKFIRSLLLDTARNVVWVAPWGNGLYQYDLRGTSMRHQTFGQPHVTESSSINALVLRENGTILSSSNGYIYQTDPLTMHAEEIASLRRPFPTPLNDLVSAIAIASSNEKLYWIGTTDGLFVLQETSIPQRTLNIPATTTATCADILIADSGVVYAMYHDGLLVVTHPKRTSFDVFPIPLKSNARLSQMCLQKHGQLWIGTTHGLILFNTLTRTFTEPTGTLALFTNTFVNTLFCDRDSDIWIGTRDPFQLFHYKENTGKLQRIENSVIDQMISVGANSRISYISEDANGYIWMRSAVGGGLIGYDKSHDIWKRYPMNQPHLRFFERKGIPAMAVDHRGNLWLSTNVADGLIRYDYQTDTIEYFTREDGILSDNIHNIFIDQDVLWLTTEYGISRLDLNTHSVVSHNWANQTFHFDAAIDTTANELIVALPGKQLFISTERKHNIKEVPLPIVDGIYVNNMQRFIDPNISTLRLPYDERNVALTFTTGYYSDADKLRFAYFLSGADHEWQYPKDTRTAQYAALAAGSYEFKIKVADQYGNWSNTVSAFSFTIVPPFWRTNWFFALAGLAVAGIVFILVRRRITTIRHEASLQHKIAETEMMALRAQMNPHFIFNCINSIDSLIHSDDKYQATLYLNKFAKLIRSILDSSKENTVTVEKDMETLRLYIELEQFRTENTFTAEIDIDPSILREDIRVPPLIIQPYVENAILHGLRNRSDEKGQLKISLQRSVEGLEYTIRDNGVGRKFATNGHGHEKVSYGMQMSSDRIKLFNNEEYASVRITDLSVNGQPGGTQVDVKLKTSRT